MIEYLQKWSNKIGICRNMNIAFPSILAFLTALLLVACGADQGNGVEDVLLAKVFNKPLYSSELEGMVPEGSQPEDSMQIVNAYVERWIRESLLMHEAEKNIPKDLNIDELVRDYRASLIRHHYEKLIVEVEMDSTISAQELQQYYEENKSQHVLKQAIVRCFFIKVPEEREEAQTMEALWKGNQQENFTELLDYCTRFASVYMLDDSTWYRAPDVLEQWPKGKLKENDLRVGKEWTTSQDGYRYLLRIHEVAPKNQTAPLSYVANQANKVILHKRKLQLLKEKKAEIYERGLKLKNIETYTH